MSFNTFITNLNHSIQEQSWYVSVLGTQGYSEMLIQMWINVKKV